MGLELKVLEQKKRIVRPEDYENGQLNLRKVCERLGVEIIGAKFEDDTVSGVIKNEGEKWTIYVNETDSNRRKRFTLAHELGHYISYLADSHSKKILENDGVHQDFAFQRTVTTESKNPDYEIEANQIAAEILMPEASTKQLHKEGKTVEEMADYFNVSESAMTFRLINLGFNPLETIY